MKRIIGDMERTFPHRRAATAALAAGLLLACSTLQGEAQTAPPSPAILENDQLRVSFIADAQTATGARFDVFDKRTQRSWKQVEAGIGASGFRLSNNRASFDLALPGHPKTYRTVITLEPDKPEITVDLLGPAETEIRTPIFFPAAFASEPNDRLIVPIGEGISYPATVSDPPLGVRSYYTGHGITMAFFAAMEERILPTGEATGGAAYMAICETPNNSGIELLRTESDQTPETAKTVPPSGKLLTRPG